MEESASDIYVKLCGGLLIETLRKRLPSGQELNNDVTAVRIFVWGQGWVFFAAITVTYPLNRGFQEFDQRTLDGEIEKPSP